MASCAAALAVIYSDSILDNATDVCIRLCHDTGPPETPRCTYPTTVHNPGADHCHPYRPMEIPGTLAKGLAGAHFGEKDQMKLKNETVG